MYGTGDVIFLPVMRRERTSHCRRSAVATPRDVGDVSAAVRCCRRRPSDTAESTGTTAGKSTTRTDALSLLLWCDDGDVPTRGSLFLPESGEFLKKKKN